MENVAALGTPGRRLHALRELGDRSDLRPAAAGRGPHRLGDLVGSLAALPRGASHPRLRLPGRGARLPDVRPARDDARELSRDPRAPRPRRHLLGADRAALAALRQGRAQRLADQRAAALAREQPEHLARPPGRTDQLRWLGPRRFLASERLRVLLQREPVGAEDRLHLSSRDAAAGAARGRARGQADPRAPGRGRLREPGPHLRRLPAEGLAGGRSRRRPAGPRPRQGGRGLKPTWS